MGGLVCRQPRLMARRRPSLRLAAPALLEAAEKVIASWETGDLAAAVRELNAAVDQAKGGAA